MREKRGREAPVRSVTFVGLASRSRRAHEGEVLLVLPWKTGRDLFFNSLHTSVSEAQESGATDASQSSFVYSRRSFLSCHCTVHFTC